MHIEASLPIASGNRGDSRIAEHEKSRKKEGCPDYGAVQILKVEKVNSCLRGIGRVFHIKCQTVVHAEGEGGEAGET